MGLPAIKMEYAFAESLIDRLNTDLMLIKLQSDNLMVMINERNKDIRDSKSTRADEVDEQAAINGIKEESKADCQRTRVKY